MVVSRNGMEHPQHSNFMNCPPPPLPLIEHKNHQAHVVIGQEVIFSFSISIFCFAYYKRTHISSLMQHKAARTDTHDPMT